MWRVQLGRAQNNASAWLDMQELACTRAHGLARSKNRERKRTNNQGTSQMAVLPLCKALAGSTRNGLHPSAEHQVSK